MTPRIPRLFEPGRCYLIAEVAQAHDGSLGMAHAFIDAAATAGVDAVKFQTHLAKEESTAAEPFRVRFSYQDASRFAYWQRMEFTEAQWQGLADHAAERGLDFLSSPFSIRAAEWLERIGVVAWKVASGETNNLPLLDWCLATGRPMLISSGLSDWTELDSLVARVKQHQRPLAVMQCTSLYPCPPERVGLNMLGEFRARYGCPVGLSDHSGSVFPALAAVALGADVLEMHLTLSREMFGPDVRSSLTTSEFAHVVEGARFIEAMQHHPIDKSVLSGDLREMKALFGHSVVAARPIAAGERIGPDLVAYKKPGTGLAAADAERLFGRIAARNLAVDEQITFQDLVEE